MDALALHRVSPVAPKTNITLAVLYDEWSAAKYKKITKSTENNYRAAWLYIKPLERAKVKDLRSDHWQAVVDKCAGQCLSVSSTDYLLLNGTGTRGFSIIVEIIGKGNVSLCTLWSNKTIEFSLNR